MSLGTHTRRERSFDQWLADCSALWDLLRGELAEDYPELPWREWYDSGLTVEAAVERADQRLFGGGAG